MLGISKRRIPAGLPGAGIAVLRVHYSADPTMTPERVEILRGTYTSKARWDREMEIAYEALEGELYYPEWDREANICEPFDVSNPDEWTIYMGCDPHPRTPTAFTWRAFNRHGDSVQCGEFWPNEPIFQKAIKDDKKGNKFSVKEYCDALDFFESDSMDKPSPFDWSRGRKLKVYQRYMDTFGKAANSDEGPDFFETYRKHGYHFQPATKGTNNLAAARDSIGAAMIPVEITTGSSTIWRAPFRVFFGCDEVIKEYERVRYPEGEPLKPKDEKVLTYRKHCIDCNEYIETARPRFVLQRRVSNDYEPIYPNLGR